MTESSVSPAGASGGEAVASTYPPDWAHPWWQDWRTWVEPVWGAWHQQLSRQDAEAPSLFDVLNCHAVASPVRFVPQTALPEGQSYEGFIFEQRQVPTRDNLHDLFNGCCWKRFPRTKARLNALQAEVIDRDGVGATRGPLRDALTLFDENALLLQVPEPLWIALQQHDWTTLLVTHRDAWWPTGLAPAELMSQVRMLPEMGSPLPRANPTQGLHTTGGAIRPVVFGHALLEKLCHPYKSITAHAYWIDPVVPASEDAWDAWLADRLDAAHMATKPFQPLPVMGIPGWSETNAHPDFYADTQVFRPRRAPKPTSA